MSDVHKKVQDQFSSVADAYVKSRIHAKGEDLKLMLNLAGNVAGKQVLDIATGAGHTALVFAEAGATVTASDLTPKMLETAKSYLAQQNIINVSFVEAAAEALPFEDQSFDIVTCRIAPHHFADPKAFVNEVARVLKPSGVFLLIDNLSPEDKQLASIMNTIEKRRDPSHVEAYSLSTWLTWLANAGLETHKLIRFERQKNYANWTQTANLSKEDSSELERFIMALSSNAKAYLDLVCEGEKVLSLSHEVILLQAQRFAYEVS